MRRTSYHLPIIISALMTSAVIAADKEPRPLLIVVDGAGDLKGCSTAVAQAVRLNDLPIEVKPFPWSHGHYKIYKDQVDDRHSRAKGMELAERLIEWRREQPDRPIFLVTYSAGAAVGLAAGNHMPANTIDRHILLSPSVSTRYDLRPSLRASRFGVDVFCSSKDKWALGIAMKLVRTADDLHDKEAAGRLGFRELIERPEDEKLYKQLRHIFWTPADAKLGHNGGHNGVKAAGFLSEQVLPLLKP